jgi:hypothetical protein
MPTDPTLGLTFTDMVLRVAEFMGVAPISGGVPIAPTDAADLARVKRCVNDGLRRVATMREWNILKRSFTLALVADTWAYYLPADFTGSIDIKLSLDPDDDQSSSITLVDEGSVRQAREATDQTSSTPTLAAIRAVTPATTGASALQAAPSAGQRWEIIFFPTPSESLTLTGRYTAFPIALSATTDRHAMGPAMDDLILSAGLAEAERQFMDGGDGRAERYFAECVTKALMTDKRSGARRLGYLEDPSDRAMRKGRVYTGVDTYNDVDV